MIALDMDGTLLDTTSRLPEENRRAVAEAAARGIEIAIVTGRRYDFARPLVEDLPREIQMIVSNGALIKSKNGETVQRRLLPVAAARRVLESTAEFREFAAVVFDRPRAAQVMMEKIDFDDPFRGKYLQRNREFIEAMTPLENCLNGEDPVQVMFTGRCRAMRDVKQALERIAAAKGDATDATEYTLSLTEYRDRDLSMVDVLQRGVTKAAALEEWARRRGIQREEVMAMGDNFNDLEMLEWAGRPVVMANGVAELKNRGWEITLGNDECGVAAAIRKFVTGGK